MDLAVAAYIITKTYPKEEMFGLTSQIRRAASSVPANIAERWGGGSSKEFIQFLRVAQGSLKEVEIHLIPCIRVELCRQESVDPLLENTMNIGKMLRSLIATLKQNLADKKIGKK